MWSLLKSRDWLLNIDSFIFPTSEHYPCWKTLIHVGKCLFSNLWSTETLLLFHYSWCANRLLAFFSEAGPDKISAGFSGRHFSTDKTRSKRKFRAVWGGKTKSLKCHVQVGGREAPHTCCVCPTEGWWFVTWIPGLPAICSCLLCPCRWQGRASHCQGTEDRPTDRVTFRWGPWARPI